MAHLSCPLPVGPSRAKGPGQCRLAPPHSCPVMSPHLLQEPWRNVARAQTSGNYQTSMSRVLGGQSSLDQSRRVIQAVTGACFAHPPRHRDLPSWGPCQAGTPAPCCRLASPWNSIWTYVVGAIACMTSLGPAASARTTFGEQRDHSSQDGPATY